MKKNIYILILSSLFSVVMFLTLPIHRAEAALAVKNATTSSSLAGWWTFDDATGTKATDFSGRGNTGTLSGFSAPATSISGWTNLGKRGGALLFDNTDDYVDIGDRPVLDFGTQDFTISGFVKKNSSVADVLVEKRGTGFVGYMLALGYPSVGNVTIFLNDGGAQKTYTFTGASASISRFALGQWFHVLVVVSRTTNTAFLYLNGTRVSSVDITATSGNLDSDASFRIGYDAGGFKFNGAIDDVRMYNKALSASEASVVYNSGQVTVLPTNKNNLVSYWPLDEGTSTVAGDFSGSRNNFTLTNFATVASSTSGWNSGKRGKALTFDGIDDYAVTNQPNIQTTPNIFTISGWIYPNDQYARFLTPNANGIDNWIGYQNTLQALEFQITEIADVNNRNRLSTTGSVPLNKWTHWAVTVNDKEIRIYINGVLDSSFTETINIGPWNAGWNLGQRGNSTGWFKGKLDDLRVYNRDLTANEIKALYKTNETSVNTAQNNKNTGGLVGYWTFNGQDTNSTIADVTGNGYHGYFIGSATSSAKTIGKVGQALLFNGSNNIVQLGTTDMGITNAFTASAWIKTTSAVSFMGIFGKDDATNRSWKLGFSGVSGQIRFDVFNATVNSSAITPIAVNDGNWHLITATYDGANSYVYVDGVQQAGPVALAGGVRSSTAIIKIGTDGCCGGRNFAGPIDEVRLYNRALSATEAKQLYLMGK